MGKALRATGAPFFRLIRVSRGNTPKRFKYESFSICHPEGDVPFARRIKDPFPETGKDLRRKSYAEHLTGLGELVFGTFR